MWNFFDFSFIMTYWSLKLKEIKLKEKVNDDLKDYHKKVHSSASDEI